MKFEFIEKGDPLGYCVSLARKMPKFQSDEDVKQMIRCRYIADDFDKDRCAQIADILADPSNCLALLSSKSFKKEDLKNHEYWYKFDYSLEKFDDAMLGIMTSPEVADNGKKLDFPPANNLIPTNFDILPKDENLSAKPTLLQQWDGIADLWYMKDDKFEKPKAMVSAKIYTKDLSFGSSVKTRMFSVVWENCLSEVLREFTYMADCANLSFEVSLLHDNINLKWSGFNDSMPNFITETLKKIMEMKNQDLAEIFAQTKEKLMQDWKNFYLQQVFRMAFRMLEPVILENSFEVQELRAQLENFTYEDFKAMQANWLESGRLLWFIHGNMATDQAKDIVGQAIEILDLK